MMKIIKILGPIIVIGIGIAVMKGMMATAPKAERHEKKQAIPVVEVMQLKVTDYPIVIKSYGTVEPSTQTTVVAEVSGKIISRAKYFNDGEYFRKNDIFLKIDPRDYQSAVTIAESELARQRVKLQQEKAQAEQALIDWKELGGDGEPNDLALRKPQLASAKADIAGAQAKLKQSKTNLERTKIHAPYDGRFLETLVDIGQYVTPATPVAKIYATDYVEIKLPLDDKQLTFLSLPEQFAGEKRPPGAKVIISKGEHRWVGEIVRSAGAIDSQSRQQFVIVKVDNPYSRSTPGRPPLKIGLFVDAQIAGKSLTNVIVIPRAALREEDSVLLVVDNKLTRRDIKIVWRTENKVVVSGGLQVEDQLITSPISYAAEGSKVTIKPAESAMETTKASTQL
ncbi:MAG TPA: efflux transporter periplasmic adaptor subunit [Gammaproteobacteria bacterium]|nr:efflux transporter periplasmic adaptor subunit [Gammaproteobacteria bacterium]